MRTLTFICATIHALQTYRLDAPAKYYLLPANNKKKTGTERGRGRVKETAERQKVPFIYRALWTITFYRAVASTQMHSCYAKTMRQARHAAAHIASLSQKRNYTRAKKCKSNTDVIEKISKTSLDSCPI